MKILFVTPSYKPAFGYGGATVAVCELAETLAKLGNAVTVYTTTANGAEELDVKPGQPVLVDGVEVIYFKRITGDHTHVSPALWRRLWKTAAQYDVVHLHSWWSFLILGAAGICRLRKRPFVLTPHGMLSGYTFTAQNSRIKKLLHNLAGRRLLRSSILHTTTALEWKECRQILPQWKGFVLFNLLALPAEQGNAARPASPAFTLGFLSRIDPKKGLEPLFRALARLSFAFRLKIAGSGEAAYIESLKTLAQELGISGKIEWCGWMKGEEKYRFLRGVDLFVLTSYSENFAIAVTESLAVGTPVLVSEGVGLAGYIAEKGLGWVCTTSPDSILSTLEQIHRDGAAQQRIRQSSAALIRQDFEKEHLATQYIQAYRRWALPASKP